MADELWSILLKFHREVAVPDFQSIVASVRDEVASSQIRCRPRRTVAWRDLKCRGRPV
jgi:hypothetical protein